MYKVYAVPKCARHFGTGAEVSRRQFGTGTEVSQIFTVVPKCPIDTSALSWDWSVLGPKCPYTLFMVKVKSVVTCIRLPNFHFLITTDKLYVMKTTQALSNHLNSRTYKLEIRHSPTTEHETACEGFCRCHRRQQHEHAWLCYPVLISE